MPSKPKVFNPRGSAQQRQQAYERERGSARDRGYDARWDRAAAAFKVRHPLCVGCMAVGRVEPAFLIDHIIPHKGNQVLLWDEGNWQSACEWHGNAIKQQLERLWTQGQGSPADLRLDGPKAKALTLKG